MKWLPKTVAEAEISSLARDLRSVTALNLNGDAHLASTLARLLVMRGITDPADAERYLIPSIAHLHSPYLLSGMRQAVDRLEAAIDRKEGVLIAGDDDGEGTNAIVILKAAIGRGGGSADFQVPHRIREGYGMKDEVIEH